MKKSIKLVTMVLTVCMLSGLLYGCSKPSEEAAPASTEKPAESAEQPAAAEGAEGGKVIGVCVADFSNQFQSYIKEGMAEEAAKHPDIKFVYEDAKMDSTKQLSQVENMIAQKVDAIVLIAVDNEASKPLVEAINKAGIPIINVNTKVANIDLVTSFVGSDTIESGRIEMEALAQAMGGKGKIVELQGIYGQEPQIFRNKGIHEVLAKYPDIEVIAENTGEWSRPKAMQVMENWLQSDLRDQITGVVAHNDEMAIGALKAAEDAGLLDKIKVAGIDATPEALDLLKEGKLAVTVFQDAKGQGSESVAVAVKAINGETVEKEYMIPYQLVTPDKADDFAAKYK